MEENTQQDGTSEEIKDPAAVLAALDRAKKDAKAAREEKEALEAKLAEIQENNTKVSNKLIREKVLAELKTNWIGNHERILKFIKFDDLKFDDELNLIGLEEQIEELKKDFPEVFDPKLLVAGKADTSDSQPVEKRLSASELQAKLVLGRN